MENGFPLSPDYILPDNDIWLIEDIPLEQNYENTILWEVGKDYVNPSNIINNETTAQARTRQFNWFTNTNIHTLIHIQATTYQREGRKYIKVDYPIKDLLRYNYLIFKNQGGTPNKYENKYYYAFITRFEYLNDRVTIIHYTIDVMQTYMFDYTPTQCFVQREHSKTDQIGDNIQPENLETGDLISSGEYGSLLNDGVNIFNPFVGDWVIIVTASFGYAFYTNPESIVLTSETGQKVNGIYTGLHYNAFNANDPAQLHILNLFLTEVTDQSKQDGIVNIFMMPDGLASYGSISGTEEYRAKDFIWDIPIDKETGLTLKREWMYGYTTDNGSYSIRKAKNKKLYTYPYTKLVIYNGSGDIGEYAFERFRMIQSFPDNITNVRFKVMSATSPNPEIVCVPQYYDNIDSNYMHKLNITGLPQCAYTIDSFRAWIAQNKYKMGINIGANAILAGAGLFTGDALSTFIGAKNMFSSVLQYVGESRQHEMLPPEVRGSQTQYLSVADKEIGFTAYSFKLRDEYANIIDDYFDLYGYATNQVKTPNRNVRENWCYCKTVGCRLRGYIPADVDEKICSIYNNGIRFWKNGSSIGSYETLTNRCVAELT